jgi:hypothetical protein
MHATHRQEEPPGFGFWRQFRLDYPPPRKIKRQLIRLGAVCDARLASIAFPQINDYNPTSHQSLSFLISDKSVFERSSVGQRLNRRIVRVKPRILGISREQTAFKPSDS